MSDTPDSVFNPPSDSSVPSLTLRATRPGDAEALADMMSLPGFRWGTLQLPYRSPEAIRSRMEKAAPGTLLLVALAEGAVIGSAALEPHAGRRAHVGSIGMGVHDNWTGRGVGRALMTALLDTADNWLGLKRVELSVYTDNTPALALYRRFGFIVEGTSRCDAFRDGTYVNIHLMGRLRP